MTSQEILEKAIQKAIDNGWRGDMLGIVVRIDGAGTVRLENPHTDEEWSVEEIIYNKKVAKALWSGEPAVRVYGGEAIILQPAWMYHLQQMVIADDPIQYLGENL